MKQEDYGKSYQRGVDVPVAALLALGYLCSMLWSVDPGYCRDETYYFRAGKQYITWINNVIHDVRTRRKGQPIKSLKRSEIKRYWAGYGNNHEHPPFAKILMGASWYIFSQKWRPPLSQRKRLLNSRSWWVRTRAQLAERFWNAIKMPSDRAYRFPGMVWACLMIFLVYLWGVQVFNRRVGMFAAFSLMLLPRFFFHAHLAAFDVPISALWLLVAYTFWRGMKHAGWAAACGFCFALALATKHNSWILPAVLGLYWLSQTWNKYRLTVRPDGTYQVRFAPLHGAVFWSMVFGPILVIGLWPLLWPTNPFQAAGWKETWQHLGFYLGFHLKHNHYDAYYFGKLYLEPPFPWHFPFGMSLVTFPIATLVLMLCGFWYVFRQQRMFIHVMWWILWTIRVPLFGWILAPLLSLIFSLILLLPAIFLGVLWLFFKLLEGLPGVGQTVRDNLTWLRTVFEDMLRDVRQWHGPSLEDPTGENRPRPVGPADKTGFLWLLNASIPLIVIALPSTPIFGGTKHWMPAWPFLALLAGVGFERICQALGANQSAPSTTLRTRALVVGMAVMMLVPAWIGLVRSHPHGLAYYNTLIGGPRGSATWKMQRSFWAPSTLQALPWLNDKAPDRRGKLGRIAVDFHDSNASNYYRQFGKLKPRVYEPWHLAARSRPYRPGDYLVFVHQKWLRTQLYQAISVMNARTPVHGVYLDEAPLITVWKTNSNKRPTWW